MRFGRMRRGARPRRARAGALLGGALLAAGTGGVAAAQPPDTIEAGRALYVRYCASCHGLDARGGGPVAEALRIAPSDLTRISARRDGRFPESEVKEIVDGRKAVRGHGPRSMPVWGLRFAAEEPFGAPSEPSVQSQLTLLLLYLESIQTSVGARAPGAPATSGG